MSIQGCAIYNKEFVDILDCMVETWTKKVVFLINYGGPQWVYGEQLTKIQWYINENI